MKIANSLRDFLPILVLIGSAKVQLCNGKTPPTPTSTSFSGALVSDSVMQKACTIDYRYLEIEGTLKNSSRYPYFDISDF